MKKSIENLQALVDAAIKQGVIADLKTAAIIYNDFQKIIEAATAWEKHEREAAHEAAKTKE